MNFLLDTHTLIWALENNPTLTENARDAIINGENRYLPAPLQLGRLASKKLPENFRHLRPATFRYSMNLNKV